MDRSVWKILKKSADLTAFNVISSIATKIDGWASAVPLVDRNRSSLTSLNALIPLQQQSDINGENPSSRWRPFGGVVGHRRCGRVVRLEGDQVQDAGLDLGRVLRKHHRGEGGGLLATAAPAIGVARLTILVAVGVARTKKRKDNSSTG